MIFTIHPEAPARYTVWLGELAESAGFRTFGMIDEPSAVAAGYEIPVSAGLPFLIIDFANTAIDILVVVPEYDSGKIPGSGPGFPEDPRKISAGRGSMPYLPGTCWRASVCIPEIPG